MYNNPVQINAPISSIINLCKKYPQYWDYYGFNLIRYNNSYSFITALNYETEGNEWYPSVKDWIAAYNPEWNSKDKNYWKATFKAFADVKLIEVITDRKKYLKLLRWQKRSNYQAEKQNKINKKAAEDLKIVILKGIARIFYKAAQQRKKNLIERKQNE